jgi:hypothetical protein
MFKKIKPFLGPGLIVLGLYILIENFIPLNRNKYQKAENEFTSLTAYLINPPQYIKHNGKNGGPFLRLQLDEIVGVKFDNAAEFLEATNWQEVLEDIRYHDTVTIKVLKDLFEKYYINKSSLSEFDKVISHPVDRFNFYSLRFKGKEYVRDIYEVAEQRRKNNIIRWSIVSLLIIAAGIWTIRARNKH